MMRPTNSVSERQRRAIFAVSGLLALFVLVACTRPEAAPPGPQAVYVTTVRNDGASTQRVLGGVIRPRIEADLSFRAGGKVTARLVDVGQTVAAGQALARIDAADYQLAVEAAAEQLRAAEVDSVQSASDAARFKRLLADGSVGAADGERQQARADAAAARMAQARRQLELARNRAGYAVLTAPFAGVVSALRFETGQMVGEGQSVATLARPGELEVLVDIPEALASHLNEYRAAGHLDGADDASLSLALRELAPAAAAQTRTFRARYTITNAVPMARMGMTAHVRLTDTAAGPSAELPLGALLTTDRVPAVWLADEKTGRLTRVPVRLVSQTTENVRVGGLADGALVVSVGAQKLDAALKVQPIRRPLEAIAKAEGRS